MRFIISSACWRCSGGMFFIRSAIWAFMASRLSFIRLASASVSSWYVFFSLSMMRSFLAPASMIMALRPPPRGPPPPIPSMRMCPGSNIMTAVPFSPSLVFRS